MLEALNSFNWKNTYKFVKIGNEVSEKLEKKEFDEACKWISHVLKDQNCIGALHNGKKRL